VKLVRAVRAYFVFNAEQSIVAAIFAEGLDVGESPHSEAGRESPDQEIGRTQDG